MAFDKKHVINNITGSYKTIGDLILKCVVYKNTLNDLDDWIHKLAMRMYVIDHFNVKNVISLRKRTYKKYIFNLYANKYSKFKLRLLTFISDNCNKQGKYFRFKIDKNLINKFKDVFIEIRNICSKKLAEKPNYSAEYYYDIITNIFKKYNIS